MSANRNILSGTPWLWDGVGSDAWDHLQEEQFAQRVHHTVASSSLNTDPPPYHFLPATAANRRYVAQSRPRVHPSHSENWLDRTTTAVREQSSYLYDHIFSAQNRQTTAGIDDEDLTVSDFDTASFIESSPEWEEEETDDADDDPEEEEDDESSSVPDEHAEAIIPGIAGTAGGNSTLSSIMAPPARPSRRTSIVDLTRTHSLSPELSRNKRLNDASASQGESSKRRRLSSGGTYDLSNVDEAPSAEHELQQADKTHEDHSARQAAADSAPQRIGQRQCIICMENFTNATVTSCGHYFCHECLYQALRASERSGERRSERRQGACPICRKSLSRRNGRRVDIIPISFMKQSTYKNLQRIRDIQSAS